MQDRFASVQGQPLVIHWKIQRHFFFTFEVDLEAVEPFVPKGLAPVELRPGVALISTGVVHYYGGHFGPDSPPFCEIVSCVQVHPDLSLPMPAPRFTFYTFAVWSDSADFVAQEGRTLYTPTLHVPSLRLKYTDDALGVDVVDDKGLILSLRNSHPDPVFAPTEFYGQHFTDRRGLRLGVFEWDGVRLEHMKPGRGSTFHPSAHWGGIDITRIHRCYRQMISEPGSLSHERFYEMSPVGLAAAK